jgi:hypothetical protein
VGGLSANRKLGNTAQHSTRPVGAILVSSIEGEVKKKHISNGWTFSRFAAWPRSRSVPKPTKQNVVNNDMHLREP